MKSELSLTEKQPKLHIEHSSEQSYNANWCEEDNYPRDQIWNMKGWQDHVLNARVEMEAL